LGRKRLVGKDVQHALKSYNPKGELKMTIQTVTLAQLEASAGNPRKAFDETSIIGLAQSIKADGLLQNLVVAKPKGRTKKFMIISGERRFRAMQHLLSQGEISQDFTVPVEVKENLTEEEILRIATIENVQRENLSPLEEATAISALVQNGEKLDEILVKTGLSVGVIKRRLALLNLTEAGKEALANKEISLSIAEALAVGTVEQQDEALDDVLGGYLDSADDIKERFFGNLPSVADAIFPKELYTGTYATDLLSDDKSTFFNDVEQFIALQRAAVENLVKEYQEKREWVEFIEGSFQSWQFKRTADGEVGGTVICMSHWGGVEVHDNLVKPTKMDTQTTKALREKPKTTYPAPLCRYMSMHKSVAVQAALIANPRKAMELAVIQKLSKYKAHGLHQYFVKDKTESPALRYVEEQASIVLETLESCGFKKGERGVLSFFNSEEKLYDVVTGLSDAQITTTLLTLSAMEFGQFSSDVLDTKSSSLLNRFAVDMGVNMQHSWWADEDFLRRRNKIQLQKIINEAGFSSQFASVADYKKGELVKKLAKLFAKSFAEQGQSRWVPEAMQFPAINPDKSLTETDLEEESDDGSEEDFEDDESLEDDE
jgi:ParB family chromosome partitioning protein